MTSHPRVVLYTAPFCAECERARALLKRREIAFEEINLSADPDRCCELETLTGGRSTPQLVIDGRPIGGFAELAALDRAGGLSLRDAPGLERSGRREFANAPVESLFETVTMEHASIRTR